MLSAARIGYACIALAVQNTDIKSCMLKNADEDRLIALIGHNLSSLEALIDYNIRKDITLFRISSDLIPFGSSLAAKLPWPDIYREKLAAIGMKIRSADIRVSMHPGQYTVINSPDNRVAERAVEDLRYHALVLDSLGLNTSHKIVLHLGGGYGDKQQAAHRFISRCAGLEEVARRRLVLENDDGLFHIADVLEAAAAAGLPVVYDNLHNAINPADPGRTDADWIRECARTWRECDGRQKVHYSQQQPDKKPGAHSNRIAIDPFLAYYGHLGDAPPDIMLEVKDKNLSALKCLLCTQNRGIGSLEAEWARYKYSVLEKCPATYDAIRALLQSKEAYPALAFYQLAEYALRQPEHKGHAGNALQHVWGYFKEVASETEKKDFLKRLAAYHQGGASLGELKRRLYRLAEKYRQDYLLDAYYFFIT